MLQLFNTLSKQKEVFKPLDAGNVGMYVCGPTVYDLAHLGNARPVVVFDMLLRVLQKQYAKVTYVRNITDVDDKINAAAHMSMCVCVSYIFIHNFFLLVHHIYSKKC